MKLNLLIILVAGGLLLGAGCASLNKTSYNVVGTTTTSVPVLMGEWNTYVKAGKSTVAEEQQVKSAYEKYQISIETVCDIGATVSSGSSTNTTVLQNSINLEVTALSDLTSVLSTFGIK